MMALPPAVHFLSTYSCSSLSILAKRSGENPAEVGLDSFSVLADDVAGDCEKTAIENKMDVAASWNFFIEGILNRYPIYDKEEIAEIIL